MQVEFVVNDFGVKKSAHCIFVPIVTKFVLNAPRPSRCICNLWNFETFQNHFIFSTAIAQKWRRDFRTSTSTETTTTRRWGRSWWRRTWTTWWNTTPSTSSTTCTWPTRRWRSRGVAPRTTPASRTTFGEREPPSPSETGATCSGPTSRVLLTAQPRFPKIQPNNLSLLS